VELDHQDPDTELPGESEERVCQEKVSVQPTRTEQRLTGKEVGCQLSEQEP
jgi:hypothetical protein